MSCSLFAVGGAIHRKEKHDVKVKSRLLMLEMYKIVCPYLYVVKIKREREMVRR